MSGIVLPRPARPALPFGWDDLAKPRLVELDMARSFRWATTGGFLERRSEGSMLHEIRNIAASTERKCPDVKVTVVVVFERQDR